VMRTREAAGREASPSLPHCRTAAGVIDSHSVRPPKPPARVVAPVLGPVGGRTRGTPARRSRACPGAGRGAQAPHSHRHQRLAGRGGGSSSRHPGS
jgi:hypothetical protein